MGRGNYGGQGAIIGGNYGANWGGEAITQGNYEGPGHCKGQLWGQLWGQLQWGGGTAQGSPTHTDGKGFYCISPHPTAPNGGLGGHHSHPFPTSPPLYGQWGGGG